MEGGRRILFYLGEIAGSNLGFKLVYAGYIYIPEECTYDCNELIQHGCVLYVVVVVNQTSHFATLSGTPVPTRNNQSPAHAPMSPKISRLCDKKIIFRPPRDRTIYSFSALRVPICKYI
jgi:hypothetical protein